MRKIQFGALMFTAIALLAGAADAQRRAVRKPAARKISATHKVVPPLEVRVVREKVGNQLSNVNDFVNKLGTIAQGLEVADTDAKAGNLSSKTAAKIEAKKKEIVEAIRNIKVGLTNLESEFRTKPALQKYLTSIQGITDLAAQAEDSAIAGKFVVAKEPLRSIAKKLTDTLGSMPL